MGLFSGFEHIVRDSEPLSAYSWFRAGGPAEYFAEPTSVDELVGLVRRCREEDLAVRLLGGGSNILISDQGVAGLVIHLSGHAFCEISVQGNSVTAGGGAKLGHVISTAVREGLAGLEPLVGIPGTVGGALHGNAGNHGADIGQWTHSATILTRSGDILTRQRDDLRFAYRHSSLDELVILSAQFLLEREDARELTKRMQKVWIVKKATHPIGDQTTGCIFKNPGGVSASSLIEQAGLKGAKVGEAEVSDRNANSIAFTGRTRSQDVVRLIDTMRSQVADRLGVQLELEIEIW